ncbi:uncharacterized protein Dere_GG26834 [Drosophila erecta]|uniref:Uncharacterized protein n=1 Tax=Drosophila erecta TaxID=7220 RepID=A0A0Q5WLQ6_DROER|nr:uncharacterized protein Dere_GG26834 [Drosophila erecta]
MMVYADNFQFFRTMPCNLSLLRCGTACSWTRLGLQSLLLEVDVAGRLVCGTTTCSKQLESLPLS